MKTWEQFLDEKLLIEANGTHSFSSTQFNLPAAISKQIIEWGKKHIPDKDLYHDPKGGCGRENEIHVTVLYGLHSTSPTQVRQILKCQKPFDMKLKEISIFNHSPEFDVVKISVDSKGLHKLNELIKGKMAHTVKFPYNPHVTIAYVKKGTANKLTGSAAFAGKVFKVNEIIFSSTSGAKTPLRID